ncbi:hypothetical protein F4677DRAFT_439169 [Hypoxylon crocopeplum]|nr:hypothetical protein F4677DRAFT_439169 [Hypoxylon crocopeplum]
MHTQSCLSQLFASLLAFQFHILSCDAQCYLPNGEETDNFPCDPYSTVGPCCGGGLGASCLSNKLCSSPEGNIIRGSCSDPNWGFDCPRYCMNEATGGTDLISCSNVTHSDTSYCCDHTVNCCDGGVGRFNVLPSNPVVTATFNMLLSRYVVIATAGSTSSTASSTSSSTTTDSSTTTSSASTINSSTASPIKEPPNSTGLTTGAKAGIGAGVGGGILFLAILIYAIWASRRRNKTTQPELPQVSQAQGPEQQPVTMSDNAKYNGLQELESGNPPGHSRPYELATAE